MELDRAEREQEWLAAANTLLALVAHAPTLSSERRPGIAKVYSSRGALYLHGRQYQQAIEDFDHALKLDPQALEAYVGRGCAYRCQNEWGEAIDDFTNTLRLDSTYARAYAELGKTFLLLHRYQEAIGYLSTAITHNLKTAEVYTNRGVAWRDCPESNYTHALADFTYALSLDPQSVETYVERGILYRRHEQYQKAIDDFNSALKLNDTLASVYAQRGRAYRKLERYQKAITDFDRALDLNPTLPWAYEQRGIAYLRLNDLNQARFDFIRGWKLDLTDVDPAGSLTMNAGWMAEWARMCQEGRDAGMAERLETIAKVDPQQYEGLVCLAAALWLRGHFNKSLEKAEEALQKEPNEWDAPFWRCMACASLHHDTEAQEAMHEALRKGMPPILLTPLHWLEEKRPDFYEQYALPILRSF